MNPWLQLLGSGGIGAIALVVINALANRRNLGAQTSRTDAEASRTDAETDEIIAKTARGLVADIQVQLDRQIAKNASLESRVDELEREREDHRLEREDHRRVLQLHASWDAIAIAKLRDCEPPVDLPDPPPLTPAVRSRRRRNH